GRAAALAGEGLQIGHRRVEVVVLEGRLATLIELFGRTATTRHQHRRESAAERDTSNRTEGHAARMVHEFPSIAFADRPAAGITPRAGSEARSRPGPARRSPPLGRPRPASSCWDRAGGTPGGRSA